MKFDLVNKIPLKLRKRSPEILAVTGVIGVVITVVTACKATTKLSDILDETKEQLDSVHKVSEEGRDNYTEEDAKKDTTIIYVQTGVKIVKLYAPAAIIGLASVSALLGSNHILKKRYTALAAAYATVDKSFKDYRARVVEKFGDKVDKELKHGIKAVEIEETTTDEKGKEKKVKKTVDEVNLPSEYARWFDESCPDWEKDSEYNLQFLLAQQQYANDLLHADGYLYLNRVYRALGLPETKAGQIVGWIYDPDDESGRFANYVDLGIFDASKKINRESVNGYDRYFIIDPNVDGNIWELMRD